MMFNLKLRVTLTTTTSLRTDVLGHRSSSVIPPSCFSLQQGIQLFRLPLVSETTTRHLNL